MSGRTRILFSAALLVLAAAPPSAAEEAPPPGPAAATASPLLTILDYFADGERRAGTFLAEAGESETGRLARVAHEARDAVVRIRVVYGRTETSYQTDHGTGFFVEGGRRILTAGHVLVALDRDASAEITVVGVDGRAFRARPAGREFSGRAGVGRDLGLLEVDLPADAPPPAALALGEPKPGRPVVILGYPARVGLGPRGGVVGDDHERNNPLLPLTFVGALGPSADGTIVPRAGCIPEGGMSGGPVLDPDGRVVAVQHSVSRHQTGEEISFTIGSSSVAEAAAWLRASRAKEGR